MTDPKTVARLTGVAYLGMLPGGIGGFLTIRPKIIDPESAAGTLANLLQHGDLALLGVAGMMTVIVAQALAALGFYALLRERHPVAAFGIAGFGLLNAAAILAGAAASWTAVQLATSSGSPGAGLAQQVHALYLFEGAAWGLGGLFFGLWLIPMGWAAWRSGFFHAGRVLGWILMVGGGLYVLGAFLSLFPATAEAGIPDLLAMPATVGELWIMGALVVVGVRRPPEEPTSPRSQ